MNKKTLLIVLLCLLMVVSTCGRDLQNYSTAVEKCKTRKGLAFYKHFVNSERRIKDSGNVLGPGKSVWISGNVSFSEIFVRNYGCFKPPKEGVRKYNISRNSIYECLKICSSSKETQYIGIGNLCYCMLHSDLQNLAFSSDCKHQFPMTNYAPADAFSTEYTETSIDVYLLTDKQISIGKLIKNMNLGQCVYFETNGTADSPYVTGSCYTKETGFVCTNSDRHTTIESCSNYGEHISIHSRSYCYSSEPSTWISSFKHCKQNSLNLIGTADRIKNEIDKSIGPASFWTGLFRTFNLSEFQNRTFAEENNICLSVLNVNNTLVFDPVDCSLEKGYICEDESSSLSPTTIDVVHSTKVINLVLIFVLTILAPVLILICVIIGKKIRKKLKHTTSARQDKGRSNDIEDINPTNMRCNLQSENMLNNSRSQEEMPHAVNPDVEYDMPSDIVPVSDTVISEYDILDTDLCTQQIKGQSSTRSDMNSYDVHTGTVREDDTNEYDHLEAHVCKQLQTSTDGIYNKVSAEDDTYNTLKLKDERNTGNPDNHEGNYSTFGKSDLSK